MNFSLRLHQILSINPKKTTAGRALDRGFAEFPQRDVGAGPGERVGKEERMRIKKQTHFKITT